MRSFIQNKETISANINSSVIARRKDNVKLVCFCYLDEILGSHDFRMISMVNRLILQLDQVPVQEPGPPVTGGSGLALDLTLTIISMFNFVVQSEMKVSWNVGRI